MPPLARGAEKTDPQWMGEPAQGTRIQHVFVGPPVVGSVMAGSPVSKEGFANGSL